MVRCTSADSGARSSTTVASRLSATTRNSPPCATSRARATLRRASPGRTSCSAARTLWLTRATNRACSADPWPRMRASRSALTNTDCVPSPPPPLELLQIQALRA
eukprot:6021606-Prymnesium_polylepis.1